MVQCVSNADDNHLQVRCAPYWCMVQVSYYGMQCRILGCRQLGWLSTMGEGQRAKGARTYTTPSRNFLPDRVIV